MTLLRFTAARTKYMWKPPIFYLHVFGDGSSNGTYKFPIRLLYFSSGSVPNKNMHTCPGGSWLSAWETDLEALVNADDDIIVDTAWSFGVLIALPSCKKDFSICTCILAGAWGTNVQVVQQLYLLALIRKTIPAFSLQLQLQLRCKGTCCIQREVGVWVDITEGFRGGFNSPSLLSTMGILKPTQTSKLFSYRRK